MIRFFRLLLFGALLFIPSFALAEVAPDFSATLETLDGDVSRYNISFLWFDQLAEGELSFSATERPGEYRAVLEARTLGVAAWLTSHRAHRYVSFMELTPDGRLRTLRHETHVLKGEGEKRKDRAKEYLYDYSKKQVVYRRAKEGVYGEAQELSMSEVPLNDFLTVFCNFRLGNYGFPAPGETLILETLEQGEPAEIQVIASPDISRSHRNFIPEGGRLFQVRMGDDLLETGGGKVFIWFDAQVRPSRAVVEGVVGIGDITGTLRN